uniref:Uncharacterized protein n=1 Tax=Leptobrachium leishanense TaxID=445787 RepID=A0A8C5MUX4_9ANUR
MFELRAFLLSGLQCTLIPGWLKQLDAGAGQVYGVNDNDEIYRLNGNDWVNIQGRLIHVSVGLSGLWGANRGNNIYKMQDGNWVQVAEQQCTQIPGWLKQIDAGAGQVYGVNDNDDIFRLNGSDFVHIPGKLIHVSVGPSGLWGANRGNSIYKMQDGNWVQVAGALKQVDAGGKAHLVGVNENDNVYCLNKDTTFSRATNVPFNQLVASLKYYSCGLYGCWGVNSHNVIYYRLNVNSENCKGSGWKHVEGQLVMVEASTDGEVYGINTVGQIYKREGISDSNPIGTEWSLVDIAGPFKHLSYDGGILWLINKDGNIFKCEDKKTLIPSNYSIPRIPLHIIHETVHCIFAFSFHKVCSFQIKQNDFIKRVARVVCLVQCEVSKHEELSAISIRVFKKRGRDNGEKTTLIKCHQGLLKGVIQRAPKCQQHLRCSLILRTSLHLGESKFPTLR